LGLLIKAKSESKNTTNRIYAYSLPLREVGKEEWKNPWKGGCVVNSEGEGNKCGILQF